MKNEHLGSLGVIRFVIMYTCTKKKSFPLGFVIRLCCSSLAPCAFAIFSDWREERFLTRERKDSQEEEKTKKQVSFPFLPVPSQCRRKLRQIVSLDQNPIKVSNEMNSTHQGIRCSFNCNFFFRVFISSRFMGHLLLLGRLGGNSR